MATPTNLPAAQTTGNVLTAAYVNDLSGAFRILQVIEGTNSTQITTTSTSYVTTNLSATITPQSTTSKILVITNAQMGKDATVFSGCYSGLFRGTVSGTLLQEAELYAGANTTFGTQSLMILDNPSTVSATTYTVGYKTSSASTLVYAHYGNRRGSIILMEISL